MSELEEGGRIISTGPLCNVYVWFIELELELELELCGANHSRVHTAADRHNRTLDVYIYRLSN
jgi:hypothetical protein